MDQSYDLHNFTNYMPSHIENFDRDVYISALFRGYSDEEAHQIALARTDDIGFKESQYRYPDPESSTTTLQENSGSLLEVTRTDVQEHHTVSATHLDNVYQRTRTGENTISTRAYNYSPENELHLTSELVASPIATASVHSSRNTSDASISPSTSSLILPDTYAGRRSARGRSNFPRECGTCGKRFLYEDSALKHYRRHHGEPPNIILRWDAPKRPPPGLPRNAKAALSQARQSLTPPTTTIATSSTHGKSHNNQLSSPRSEGTLVSGFSTPSMSDFDDQSEVFYDKHSSENEYSKIGKSLFLRKQQTDKGSRSQYLTPRSLVDQGLGFTSVNDDHQHNSWNAYSPPDGVGHTFSPHDARHAIVQAQQVQSDTLPQTAQEAIIRANPHLLRRRLARSEPGETAMFNDEAQIKPRNINYLRSKASTGEYPPLPPDWAYDENNDASLTFHPEFGSYYRKASDGMWLRWSADTCSWEES